MATVNKHFRIKHGLIVEGTSGTINGQNILTETGSDQYILDLIGGETLVKSVSNQFDVSVAGELSLDRTVVDTYYDAAGSAATAQGAAEDYADGLAVNYDAAGVASGLVDDVLDGTTPFTEINVNDQAKQIAATASINTGSASTVYQWGKADYRSAKLLVKIDNGTHNEVSEILLTLDSSDNIAITEYAIVGTNGSRGTVTAAISGSNVIVTVAPTSNSTVKVTGTLLK